jgi:acyl-CoA dehydrogenase
VLAARTLTARACLASADAALAVVGGAAMRRDLTLERIFRDVQGARFHPMAEQPQLCLTGRHALGLPLDA